MKNYATLLSRLAHAILFDDYFFPLSRLALELLPSRSAYIYGSGSGNNFISGSGKKNSAPRRG